TVLIPSSRQAMITRSAISPRLAIRIFLNMRLDGEETLAVLDRLAVLNVALHDLAVDLGVDLVHQLHRLDDAEHLPFLDDVADLGEGPRARFRRTIEGTNDR